MVVVVVVVVVVTMVVAASGVVGPIESPLLRSLVSDPRTLAP